MTNTESPRFADLARALVDNARRARLSGQAARARAVLLVAADYRRAALRNR